jgi:hypothetical protein
MTATMMTTMAVADMRCHPPSVAAHSDCPASAALNSPSGEHARIRIAGGRPARRRRACKRACRACRAGPGRARETASMASAFGDAVRGDRGAKSKGSAPPRSRRHRRRLPHDDQDPKRRHVSIGQEWNVRIPPRRQPQRGASHAGGLCSGSKGGEPHLSRRRQDVDLQAATRGECFTVTYTTSSSSAQNWLPN